MNKISTVAYFGGKATLCGRICDIIDNTPHTTYVEPFGGSGIILLNKRRSMFEIYNDLDDLLTNMFQQIRDNYPNFKRRISRCLYSRKEYLDAFEHLKTSTDPLIKAVSYWYCLDTGFAGLSPFKSSTFRFFTLKTPSFFSKLRKIIKIRNRLRNVQILNKDAIQLITQTDSPDTLFYIDPPYTVETRGGTSDYKYEIDPKYHAELSKVLLSVQGKFILSNYDDPVLRNMYKNCNILEINTVSTVAQTARPTKIELLIFNFKYSTQQIKLL